jgi:hypothetical protein
MTSINITIQAFTFIRSKLKEAQIYFSKLPTASHLSYHSQLESALRLEINTPTCPPLHVCETRYGLHDKQHGCHMQFSIACFNLTDHLHSAVSAEDTDISRPLSFHVQNSYSLKM